MEKAEATSIVWYRVIADCEDVERLPFLRYFFESLPEALAPPAPPA